MHVHADLDLELGLLGTSWQVKGADLREQSDAGEQNKQGLGVKEKIRKGGGRSGGPFCVHADLNLELGLLGTSEVRGRGRGRGREEGGC